MDCCARNHAGMKARGNTFRRDCLAREPIVSILKKEVLTKAQYILCMAIEQPEKEKAE